MLETEPFVEQIIANPHDDTARLIFADYLEEHGDPRAEMIRLQFEMAELSSLDPLRDKLRRRELQLLRKHGIFGRAPDVAKVVGHHGGFVDAVELTVTRFLKLQDELFRSAPIREVHLKSRSAKFEKIAESPWLSQLSTLVLKQNHAGPRELITVLSCPRLNQLQRLEVLAGDTTNEYVLGLAQAPNLASIEHLVLYGYHLNHLAGRAVARSPVLQNLKSLHIGGYQNDTSLAELSESPNCEHLEELKLRGGMTGTGLLALQNGTTCRKLVSLDVALGGGLHENAFAAGRQLENLRHLTVGTDYRYGDPQVPVSALTLQDLVDSYPQLETLNLAGNLINTEGAMVLASSPILRSLKKLVLTNNQITVDGVDAIAQSTHFHRKLKLYLRSNRLSVTDIRALRMRYGKTFGNMEPEKELQWRSLSRGDWSER